MARLIGQRPLFAQFDPPEQAAPLGACLFGERDQKSAHLNWRVPDNGGAAIASYKVYRGTTPDAMTFLAQTKTPSPGSTTRRRPGVTEYSYTVTALNSVGEGLFSNVVTLPVTPIRWRCRRARCRACCCSKILPATTPTARPAPTSRRSAPPSPATWTAS